MYIHEIKLVVMDVDGSLTDAGIYITAAGDEFKKFNARDGLAITTLEKNGIRTGLLSHAKTPIIVERRAAMLKTSYCYAGEEKKAVILQQWIEDMGIEPENVLFFGDDNNDLDAMEMSGMVACPANASSTVKLKAHHICTKAGGDGAFRELAEAVWPHLFGV
ncbi:MAG: HAD hydrolase family protein [Bacteroidia bacterium]|nr:HAD hydrolase family protein [Bacteroidia bacterium]